MQAGDAVIVKYGGEEFWGVVIGWLPCGHLVVSVDGKSVAVPPNDVQVLGG